MSKAKKVIFVIVEGPTDKDALSSVLKQIFSSAEVHFHVIYNFIARYRTKCIHFSPQASKSLPVKFRPKFTAGKTVDKPNKQSNEWHKEAIEVICGSKSHQPLQKHSSKIGDNPSSKPVYQCTNQAAIHPSSSTRRSAFGQSRRPGGAPGPGCSEDHARQIKHDKMKQFYMIDMERKRW